MGLRTHLRQLRRTRRRPTAFPEALQLQSTTRLPWQTSAGLAAEQPRWELQLACRRGALQERDFRLLFAGTTITTIGGPLAGTAPAFGVLDRAIATAVSIVVAA